MSTENRHRGRVLFWNPTKAFGFVSCGGAKDIFFHISGCRDYEARGFAVGEELEYVIGDDNGRPKAVDITRVGVDNHCGQ